MGAPIFYRDVPLMPSAGANGTVQPLSPASIHLIKWRIRDITRSESHTVLTDMPTCANCHSFSRDGKTMGIDVDGPANDKGLYAVVPVAQKNVDREQADCAVEYGRAGGKDSRGVHVAGAAGAGRYVLSTFAGSASQDVSTATYYVTNFKDYRFLQVFFIRRVEFWSGMTVLPASASRCRAPTIRATCRRTVFGVRTANGLQFCAGRGERPLLRQDNRRRCTPTILTRCADTVRPLPCAVQREGKGARRRSSRARRRTG